MAGWERRRVGRTGLEVTVLGFGTATMGGSRIPVSREESEAMVRAAWDAGVRYVDTAPFYGVGSAEHRVGDALRDKPRDEWVLSTKVGRLLKPRRGQEASTDGRLAPMPFTVVYDYSYDAIMRSMDDSYQRLGLDKIDILYVHDIGAYQHKDAAPGHMKTLRDSGYRALTDLKSGDRVKKIQAICDRHNVPLPAAALQFPLAHPAVAATIPGPRTVEEFKKNLELIRMKIPAGLWAELKRDKLLHPDAPVPG